MGLSPRMRGNLARAWVWIGSAGPIPAHAGEPFVDPLIIGDHKAYPRACGGTSVEDSVIKPEWGLSPRMRGNRRVCP